MLAVLALALLIASPLQRAEALSCVDYLTHDEFVKELASSADALFTGVVLRRRDVEPTGDVSLDSWAYDFQVEAVLKGQVKDQVTVRAPSDQDVSRIAGGPPQGLRLETGRRTFVAVTGGRANLICGTLTTQELVDLREAEVQRALGLSEPIPPVSAGRPGTEPSEDSGDSSSSTVMPWVALGAIAVAAALVLVGPRDGSAKQRSGAADVRP